jgi:hypothetical protein
MNSLQKEKMRNNYWLLLVIVFVVVVVVRENDAIKFIPRSTVFSGLQTISSNPLYFGFAYNEYSDERGGFIKIRETATYEDHVQLKIIRSDPEQMYFKISLSDSSLHSQYTLNITCVPVNEGSFAYRIEGDMINDDGFGGSLISLYLYIGVTDGFIQQQNSTSSVYMIQGKSRDTGSFRLINLDSGVSDYNYYGVNTTTPFSASTSLLPMLQKGVSEDGNPACCYPFNHEQLLPNIINNGSNQAIVQKVLQAPFRWTVAFESENYPVTRDFNFDMQLHKSNAEFEAKFDVRFPLKLISVPSLYAIANEDEWKEFGRQLLSSLLYGLSYFEGDAQMKDPSTDTIWTVKDRKLLTFIPAKVSVLI